MSVSNAMGSALYSTLTGGTALTALLSGTAAVYYQQAPDAARMPYVVYSLQAGGPLNINPSDLRDQVYFVRGYAASGKTAGLIDAQISNLLHHGTLTVSGYTNMATRREADFENVQNLPDGTKVYMAGAIYRIRLDS